MAEGNYCEHGGPHSDGPCRLCLEMRQRAVAVGIVAFIWLAVFAFCVFKYVEATRDHRDAVRDLAKTDADHRDAVDTYENAVKNFTDSVRRLEEAKEAM